MLNFSGQRPQGMTAGSNGKSQFSFVRNQQSSKMAVPFCIPGNSVAEFLLLPVLFSLWCQCSGFCPF